MLSQDAFFYGFIIQIVKQKQYIFLIKKNPKHLFVSI